MFIALFFVSVAIIIVAIVLLLGNMGEWMDRGCTKAKRFVQGMFTASLAAWAIYIIPWTFRVEQALLNPCDTVECVEDESVVPTVCVVTVDGYTVCGTVKESDE